MVHEFSKKGDRITSGKSSQPGDENIQMRESGQGDNGGMSHRLRLKVKRKPEEDEDMECIRWTGVIDHLYSVSSVCSRPGWLRALGRQKNVFLFLLQL